MTPGTLSRASAMTVPAIVLWQPELAHTAPQRALPPLRSHRDAVGDRDGVELDRRAAGRPDPLLDLLGQLLVVPVTRRHLDPAVRDADQRAGEVLVREADRLEVGAGGSA